MSYQRQTTVPHSLNQCFTSTKKCQTITDQTQMDLLACRLFLGPQPCRHQVQHPSHLGRAKRIKPRVIGTDGLTHLDSLDCLMHERQDQMENISNGSVDTATTPDKTRQKLHQHAQELVRKMTVAHQTSSDTDADESATALRDLRINGENKFKGVRLAHTPLIARPLGCTKLLKRRQLELWRTTSTTSHLVLMCAQTNGTFSTPYRCSQSQPTIFTMLCSHSHLDI